MMRITWFWIAALVITFAAIVFQRQTGPTYPRKVNLQIDTTSVIIKLPRSYEVGQQVKIEIPSLSWDWTPYLYYRPYPSNNDWHTMPYDFGENTIIFHLPIVEQKAAKLEYYIELSNLAAGKTVTIPEGDPIIIRFKGAVPTWALLPHIVLLFIAMILSNLSGFMALFNHNQHKLYGFLTLVLIGVGGLVFGPIVQKYAFNHYWTGFPFGSDLTDNKTLIMFVVWAIAVFANRKKEYRWLTILAAVVTIVVYCIPHSLRGSQFDYETGEIVTGFVSHLKLWF